MYKRSPYTCINIHRIHVNNIYKGGSIYRRKSKQACCVIFGFMVY